MITEIGAVKVRGGEVLGEFRPCQSKGSYSPADRSPDGHHQPDGCQRTETAPGAAVHSSHSHRER
jgi:hypothetical protein